LGVARLISSARHDVGEDRAGLEAELAAAAGAVDEDRGADDVGGHQVRGELDAGEAEVDRAGEGADHQRLAEARDALEQAVAAGEQAGEDAAQDLVLADDDRLDLADEAVQAVLDGFELGLRLGDRHVGGGRE
jgi:hypothetical protein